MKALVLVVALLVACDCDEPVHAPDAAPACLPAYRNDSGIVVEERCAIGVCVQHACLPCGAPGEPCCHAGTWLYCDHASCVAGTCR